MKFTFWPNYSGGQNTQEDDTKWGKIEGVMQGS